MPDDEQVTLRKTTFGDGQTYPDDWQVFWRDMQIGRILKQPGVPFGRPNWWWGVNFDRQPSPPATRASPWTSPRMTLQPSAGT